MADDRKTDSDPGEIELEADAEWSDDTPDEKTKLRIFEERLLLAKEHQKDWLWHCELAFEYKESSQIPPELRGLNGDVLYWVLNVSRDIIANTLGSLTGADPIPVWSGRGFDDEKGGRAISDVFAFTANRRGNKLKVLNAQATGDMVTCGAGFVLEYYDEDAIVHLGKNQKMFGDVAAEVLDPRRVLGDPTHRWKDKPPEWMIYTRPVKLRWLKQKYQEKADWIKGKRLKVPESLISQRSTKDYANTTSPDTDNLGGGESATNTPHATSWTRIADVEEHYYVITEAVDKVYVKIEPPPPPEATVTPYAPGEPEGGPGGGAPAFPGGGPGGPAGMPPGVGEEPPEESPIGPKKATEEESEMDDIIGWEPVEYGPEDILPEEKDKHFVKRVLVNKVRRAMVCENILLEDKELHFSSIPIAMYLGEAIQGHHMPVGIMYHIRHAQDLVNTLISSVGENALLTNNPWILYEATALEQKMKDRLEQHGGGPGLKLEVNPGQIANIQRRDPPPMPNGTMTLWKEIVGLVDRIAGKADVQFGRPPYDMSGRGLIASQQAADLSSTGWMQGMIAGQEVGASLRLENIQKKYVYARALRITDDMGEARVSHLRKVGDSLAVVAEDGEVLLADLSVAEFDIELQIEPGGMDTPELKQKKGQLLFEAGVYTKQRFAEAYGVKHADKVIAERDEEDKIQALGKAAMEASATVPEIQKIIEDPTILQGLTKAAEAFKALSADPALAPFVEDPNMLHRLVQDAMAHHKNLQGLHGEPPPAPGSPPAPGTPTVSGPVPGMGGPEEAPPPQQPPPPPVGA